MLENLANPQGWKKRRDAAARRRKGGKTAEERAEVARIRAAAADPMPNNEAGNTALGRPWEVGGGSPVQIPGDATQPPSQPASEGDSPMTREALVAAIVARGGFAHPNAKDETLATKLEELINEEEDAKKG